MSDLAMTTSDIISLSDNISGSLVLLLIGYAVFQGIRKVAPWLAEREAAQQARLDRIIAEQQDRIDQHTQITMSAHQQAITALLENSDKNIGQLIHESEKDRELLRVGLTAIDNRLQTLEKDLTLVKDRLSPGLSRSSER